MPSTQRRLKIAYLCESHPELIWAHSGGNTRIFNTLQEHVGDVTFIDNRWGRLEFLRQLIHKLPEAIKLRLRFRTHLFLSSLISRNVTKLLAQGEYDILFCAYSFFCLSGLKLPYPMLTIFTSDATYTAYKNSAVGQSFKSYLSVSRWLDPIILRKEKKVYRNVDLLLWPSHWISDSAQSIYQLPSEQCHVIHWGANVVPPKKTDININLSIDEPVKLLLVGRDWFHKGGPLAHAILMRLRERGVDAHLSVVGCTPPKEQTNEHMTVYGELDKTDPKQLKIFTELYLNAHFFVMPSYEAYGFAFCEAGAYALPALCLRVGGVPIIEGINGHALPLLSGTDDFCKKIIEYIDKPESYRAMRASTRAYYEEHLHWDAWGNKVAALLQQHIAPDQIEKPKLSATG